MWKGCRLNYGMIETNGELMESCHGMVIEWTWDQYYFLFWRNIASLSISQAILHMYSDNVASSNWKRVIILRFTALGRTRPVKILKFNTQDVMVSVSFYIITSLVREKYSNFFLHSQIYGPLYGSHREREGVKHGSCLKNSNAEPVYQNQWH